MHIRLTCIFFVFFFTFLGKTNTVFPSAEDFNEACAWGMKKKTHANFKMKIKQKRVQSLCKMVPARSIRASVCCDNYSSTV